MTEKANPSINRPAEAYKTAGAIAYGGHGEGGFISPAAEPTDISVQDAGINHNDLNAFEQIYDAANDEATIDPGEAFVFGTWLATDETYTISLAPDTADQTVYLGWNKSGPDDVIVGLDSAFSTATGDADEKIPLYTYDTVGGNVTDERTIGYTEYIEGKSFYGDEDFSLSYNEGTDELEIIDEVNDVVKASFDKNGDVHIKNGDLDLQADLRDGTTTIYDQTNGYLPQARLENDSITVDNGDGIVGDSISLGGSSALDVNVSDLTGAFLADDGTNAFEVLTGTALGDDGTGNLQVNLGDYVSDDGSNNLTLNLGATLTGDGSGNVIVDGSSDVGFSSTQTFTGNIDLSNTGLIKNAPSPQDGNDLARKEYVDSVAEGLNLKDSVAVSDHDTQIDLTSTTDPNPLDGYTLSDGERVLLKHQTDATENGIYDAVVATDPSTWVRSSDFDDDADVTEGSFAFIRNGTAHANEAYVVTTPDPITVGTDTINWSQFSFAGEFEAGEGLSKSDNIFQIDESYPLVWSALQTFNGDIDLNDTGLVKNSPAPVDQNDLSRKEYVDTNDSEVNTRAQMYARRNN